MKTYYLSEDKLVDFVQGLMGKCPVIAPVAKKSRFVFEELAEVSEVRLDYDTTILPPKKMFFPTRQDLVKFDGASFDGCIDPKERILLGVHPYDIKGISMSDKFYSDNNVDNNYMANRNATVIIGASVQNHYKNAFFGTVGAERPVEGHDAFMTKVDGGYVVEVLTDKGSEVVAGDMLTDASDEQIAAAAAANKAADDNCPEKLNGTTDEINEKVRSSFSADVWVESSESCFSCGSCNTVCPTCYCFDVQDEWNLDGASGTRYRTWDACLTCEFSEVSVQGGCENFREEKAERFRHRFMRKTSYLNDQLGGPACVGCGRCSGACTADIANPVTVINKIMES
jgi:formate hydrogenlyase subunit 6/NADH:ubiquinone oxidoreductase subunit I